MKLVLVQKELERKFLNNNITYGSIETTIEATKQALQDAAESGGYILGAGSDILSTCKYENVKVMVETVKKSGTYPIRNLSKNQGSQIF